MKKRLDIYLVEKGLCTTLPQAQALIMSGVVRLDGQTVTKSGAEVKDKATVELKEQLLYVSRGGLKLAQALKIFSVKVSGRSALDIGASTGGFSDCLLQQGAAYIYAFDVGYNQLAYKLRSDPRVRSLEKINFRYFTEADWQKIYDQRYPAPDLAVIDVSFISLELIFPPLVRILPEGSELIALVKPQFEADREDVGKGGIISNERVWQKVKEQVRKAAELNALTFLAETDSPITGHDGNKEFLFYLRK